jgi:hypothetical protein
MTKQKRRKPPRQACPFCAQSRPGRGLPLTLPFGIPTYWSPEVALAIFEFVDDMRDVILAAYCTQLQDAARKQRQFPNGRAVIPDDELPF